MTDRRLTLTSLEGVLVGHATDRRAATGCTVIVCPDGAVAGVDVGGGAAGTREIDACAPGHLVERIHAVVLSGGSAFGLDTAGGVMRYLERKGIGFDTGSARIPIVPSAILYDLGLGSSARRPDGTMGARACRSAFAAAGRPVASGSLGAGTGATVGKIFGMKGAMKGGIGNAGLRMPSPSGKVIVAVLAAVNAFGDVIDYDSGAIVAGARAPSNDATPHAPHAPLDTFADTERLMRRGVMRRRVKSSNTTLVVVATDARLTRVEAARLSRVCQDGLARSVSPCHTRFDGDIVFTLSMGRRRVDLDCLGVTACRAVGMAVIDAVTSATTLKGVPALRDLPPIRRGAQPRK